MSTAPTPRVYRLRHKGTGRATVPKTFSLSPQALTQLDTIRRLFERRYPREVFPTLSGVLEQLILSSTQRYAENPRELTADVKDFRQRYPRRTKPAVIQTEEKGYPQS